MHDSLLEGLSPKSFHALTYHTIYEITIISILECILWDPYIYLKVVVSDEKVPEDSGLVEIAQTDHVFNSLIRNNLVVHNDHNNHDCYDNIDGVIDEIQ